MTVKEKAYWWLAITAVFFAFVWLFKSILLPFVAGIAIAYFLDPLADWMERRRLPRALAALLSLIAFCIVAVAGALLLLPVVKSQIVELSARMPAIIEQVQAWLIAALGYLKDVLTEEDFQRLRSALASQAGSSIQMATDLIKGLLNRGIAFFEFLSVLFVTPVVAFYLLRDWDRMISHLDGLIPLEHRQTVHTQMARIDDTLAGFARGQASVCVLLGLGYGGALALAGLPFGFTVGLAAGLVSFVPYLGSIFGLVASIGLALLEFDDPLRIAIVAAIFVVGQMIEGNYLTPKLVGERVRLHPVWVIFALFAGGSLLGFLGMLIALPVAAVLGVLARFLIDQYRTSTLYEGSVPNQEPDD